MLGVKGIVGIALGKVGTSTEPWVMPCLTGAEVKMESLMMTN